MLVHDVAATEYPPPASAAPLTLAVHGGLGDPGHSVVALYAPTLRKFGATLVAVDPRAADAQRRAEVSDRLGLSYAECLTPQQHADRLAAGWHSDAALLLTPVITHLAILTGYAAAPRPPRIVVVEKPAVGLAEVAALADVVTRLGQQNCYFIGTAMVAASTRLAARAGVLEQVGTVRSIVALGVDNPWAPPAGQEAFSLRAKQQALNARGVLLPEHNGSAGAGFDMGIHAVTGLSVVLGHLGLALPDLTTRSVRLELADLPGWRRGPGAETHLLVSGRIGDIDIVVEAGKGSDTWDRRVEVYGDEGECVMGFGTLAHRPAVWLRTAAGEQLWRFPDADTGYSHHLHDLAILLGRSSGAPTLTPAESARHMLASLRLMAAWYTSCGDPPHRREPIARVPGHTNPLLTDRQVQVRRRLADITAAQLRL